MGAWGYGSFDNDGALDFLSTLFNKSTLKQLSGLSNRKKFDWSDYDNCRMMAEIFIHLHKINNLWFDFDVIEGVMVCLEHCLEDKDYFNSWVSARDAGNMKRQIRRFVKQLSELDAYGR